MGIPVIIQKLHTVCTLIYRDVHTLPSYFQICEQNRDENYMSVDLQDMAYLSSICICVLIQLN